MAALMKPIDAYKGHIIYDSANTHPDAKTKALAIRDENSKSKFFYRVRYVVGDAQAYVAARKKIEEYIDKHF